jgi:hypothetical protein
MGKEVMKFNASGKMPQFSENHLRNSIIGAIRVEKHRVSRN